MTIDEVIIFWNKARIPCRYKSHCVVKLKELYSEWQSLQKSVNRKSATNVSNQLAFTEKLDDLFDIAAANAVETITIKEDRQFLINQRKKGREGSMYGIDQKLAKRERLAARRSLRMEELSEREAQEKSERGRLGQFYTYFTLICFS